MEFQFPFSADGTCDGVQCHVNATCYKPSAEDPGLCVCRDGWQGDGKTCEGQNLKKKKKKKAKPFALKLVGLFLSSSYVPLKLLIESFSVM